MSYLFLIVATFISVSHAQNSNDDIVSVTEEGSVSGVAPTVAKQKILRDVIQRVSSKYIEDLIGGARYEQNSKAIQRKIIDNSGRYIPIIKNSDLVQNGDQFKMTVTVSLSRENLRALLVKEGLMNVAEGPAAILPMITFSDRTQGVNYRWWTDSNLAPEGTVRVLNQILTEELRSEFLRSGFYMLDTTTWNYRNVIPPFLHKETISASEQTQVQDRMGAQILLRGNVTFEAADRGAYRLQLQITAYHGGNGKVLGEVRDNATLNSNLTTSPVDREKISKMADELAKDLTSQVFEVWQKGGVGAHFLTLEIRGYLTFAQLEKFKNSLEKVRAIRNLKERRFEVGRTTFEVDASSTPQQLATQMNTLQSEGFSVKVSDVDTNSLVLDVKAL